MKFSMRMPDDSPEMTVGEHVSFLHAMGQGWAKVLCLTDGMLFLEVDDPDIERLINGLGRPVAISMDHGIKSFVWPW